MSDVPKKSGVGMPCPRLMAKQAQGEAEEGRRLSKRENLYEECVGEDSLPEGQKEGCGLACRKWGCPTVRKLAGSVEWEREEGRSGGSSLTEGDLVWESRKGVGGCYRGRRLG
jgi:hypothetical protein